MSQSKPQSSRRWQFSLSHLLLAMMPVGFLFAWLGSLETTTWLHLLLCGVIALGYLVAECFGDHAAAASARWPWRASYFLARGAFLQTVCVAVCFVSFTWLPPDRPPEPPPPRNIIESLNQIGPGIGRGLSLLVPYVFGFTVFGLVCWLANLLAAFRIGRARWWLIATTPPGASAIWFWANVLLNDV